METKKLDIMKVYDWRKTAKNKLSLEKFRNTVQQSFSKEIKYYKFTGKIIGVWKNWEFTDEGEGEHPIFKFTIQEAIFLLNDGCKTDKYLLMNEWIKLGLKIKCDTRNKNDIYSIDEKNLKIYNIDSSFELNSEDIFEKSLLENLIISYVRDNLSDLNKFIRQYKIQTKEYETLNLLGWDITNVVSYKRMNEIVKQNQMSETIAFKNSNRMGSIDGQFGIWSVGDKSEGRYLNMVCPIIFGSGSYWIGESVEEEEEIDFNFTKGSSVSVSVDLSYFDREDQTFWDLTSKNEGTQYDLEIITTTKPIHSIDVTIPMIEIDEEIIEYVIEPLFKNWFQQNISKFQQIFNSVLLNDISCEEGFQWLKPTAVSYGCNTSWKKVDENKVMDDEKSVFGLMAMVENHSKPDANANSVDGRMLSSSASESAFATSIPIFVKNWIYPSLNTLQTATLDTFKISENGAMITNTKRFQYATVTEEGVWENKPAYIDPENFKLEVVNDQIRFSISNLQIESGGIIAHIEYKQTFYIELKDNKYLIVKENEESEEYSVYFTEEDWRKWTDLCVEIIGGIALGFAFGYVGQKAGAALKKFIKGKKYTVNGKSRVNGKDIYKEVSKETQDGIELQTIKRRNSLTESIQNSPTNENGDIIITNEGITNNVYKPTTIPIKIFRDKWKIIGSIIGSAIGGVVPTAIIGILNGVWKDKFPGQVPTIQKFVNNAVGSVKWPDQSNFNIKSAKLRGVYLLGGDLVKEEEQQQ